MSSTGPSLPNESTPTQVVGSIESEEARKREAAAAAQRYAEVSLKSVPIPEGVDPNQRATVGEAVKSIKAEDFTRVHQAPCTREGLLTGIGSGAAIGALRYITGGMYTLLGLGQEGKEAGKIVVWLTCKSLNSTST